MKRWKVRTAETSSASVPVGFAVRVVAAIGTPELARGLLEAMQRLMPASHCTVFALEGDGRVSAVSTASAHGVVAAITATEYYRNGFDLIDSNMVWLARKQTPRRSQTWLSHQCAEEVADPNYRRVCYGEPGIRERTSVLLLLDDGRRIAVSFYRNLAFAPFGPQDFDTIAACAPLLQEAVIAHVRQVGQHSAGAGLRQKILSSLPSRERQVITHVLAGRTTREAAEILRLAPTTVLTYRYRAFAKLGVRTQRELFAMLDRLPANVAPAGRVAD